jgi:hypothetical protein
MGLDAFGQTQTAGQFLGQDDLRVVAQNDMNLVLARIEFVEEALRVDRAAGSGDGNKDFHPFTPVR